MMCYISRPIQACQFIVLVGTEKALVDASCATVFT